MAGDPFEFEKLAKEIVLSRLKDAPDAHALAAEVAKQIAVTAVTSTREKQDPQVTVTASCKGVMEGIMVLEKDMPKTAVALLQMMATIAQEANLDPGECMTWAMKGIAPICKLTTGPIRDSVQAAIEENFMGAGQVFSDILQGS